MQRRAWSSLSERFPEINWYTSDPELLQRKNISSCIDYEKLNKKMHQPFVLDIEEIPVKLAHLYKV